MVSRESSGLAAISLFAALSFSISSGLLEVLFVPFRAIVGSVICWVLLMASLALMVDSFSFDILSFCFAWSNLFCAVLFWRSQAAWHFVQHLFLLKVIFCSSLQIGHVCLLA